VFLKASKLSPLNVNAEEIGTLAVDFHREASVFESQGIRLHLILAFLADDAKESEISDTENAERRCRRFTHSREANAEQLQGILRRRHHSQPHALSGHFTTTGRASQTSLKLDLPRRPQPHAGLEAIREIVAGFAGTNHRSPTRRSGACLGVFVRA
jgi:hypothetical protein